MVLDKERCISSAVKKLPELLRGITSKHDFLFLNCLNYFRSKNKFQSCTKVRENKDFYGVVMSSDKNKILEFNQFLKSDKVPYIIYADLESLIEKYMDSSSTEIDRHIPSGYLVFTIRPFYDIKHEYNVYRDEDCKKFCESLTEHAKNIIEFEKKKMIPLRNKQKELHDSQKS